jgi:cytochrome-b5 reductase
MLLRNLVRRSSTVSTALEYASSCIIPTTWLPLPLLTRKAISHDSSLLEFGLPEGKSLNLPTCACVLVCAPGMAQDGSDVVRPYTPISKETMLGKFELLVKRYDGGVMSSWLDKLPLGASVDFKHIPFNLKVQYPFEGKKSITLVCAGTGITPMYQALHKLLDTPGDDRSVTLLYGNKSADDILLKDELDAMAAEHGRRLKVVHVLGAAPDDAAPPGWQDTPTYVAETGWIDRAKIEQYAFPPSSDTLLFVCGLPAMYEALCGPRTEAGIVQGSVLHELGYTEDMVAKM